MTVRRLRSKQHGPSCSYCAERAVWRGVYFTRFACSDHKPQLDHADAEQTARDEHYETGRAYSHGGR
jgi:hypothetical protein